MQSLQMQVLPISNTGSIEYVIPTARGMLAAPAFSRMALRFSGLHIISLQGLAFCRMRLRLSGLQKIFLQGLG